MHPAEFQPATVVRPDQQHPHFRRMLVQQSPDVRFNAAHLGAARVNRMDKHQDRRVVYLPPESL
ncbi:hypothetical protein OY671_010697, partial [Metschnikowia pulcherrima]